jgi:hypothetical protein
VEKEKIMSGRSLGGSLVALGVGGASYFAAFKAATTITSLQGRWWAAPLVLAVAGHLGKSISSQGGTAAIGAAGSLMAQGYYVSTQTLANPAPAPAPAPAQGFARAGDAGSLILGAGEAGALNRPQLPAGRTGMMQFRGGYAGRGAPSRYRPSMAGALIS